MVPRLADANIVMCKWVFIFKYHPNDTIAGHKARLVAREFTQAYGIDYAKAFSQVVYLNSVCMFLSLIINQAWSLHQLDVSSAFLYGDLKEQVFMEYHSRYIALGELSKGVFPTTSYLRTQSNSTCLICQFQWSSLYLWLHIMCDQSHHAQ